MSLRRLDFAIVLFGVLVASFAARADEPAPISRIGFGSCCRQDKPQPIWEAVVATKPQLFVLLGDNIYADTQDMAVMKAKYDLQLKSPGFIKLKATCPLLATWDDHDYGDNDVGAEYPLRKESQQLFLDFFGVPKDSPRRTQEGVYSASIHGPPGKRVQIILLDQRYFRSRLKKGFVPGEPGEGVRGLYAPNDDPAATVLGEKQWAWLAEQLRQPAELRLLGSSFQCVADEHGWECWGNFPRERARLLKLIRESRAEGLVVLSGDRHKADISRLPTGDAALGYPLIDITSSSFNEPTGDKTKAGTRFVNEVNSKRVGLVYFDTNFGFVDIDWASSDPVVRLQIRDELGDVVLQHRLRLSELRPAK